MSFPYSYISCPCTDVSIPVGAGHTPRNDDDEEQERTFDPSSPRANYSLYPLEHLMYCEDCQQIRCPRCTIEEIVCWYCPTCLFEMPSSMLRSDGYRCSRNCFTCPICSAPMTVNTFDPEGSAINGPWILACGYCNWTTLDIGIKFDKPSNLAVQLSKLNNGGTPRITPSIAKTSLEESEPIPDPLSNNDPDAKFQSLKSFLSSQLSISPSSSNPLLTPSGEYNYSSPSSLARIMSLYTGLGSYGKKSTSKTTPIRESASPSEGLHIVDPASDAGAIQKLRTEGWAGTASIGQRAEQRHPPHFIDDVRPVAQILRTKRSKRCRTCRHILVKPEPKVTSTRFRIRLVALNYIPTISLKPLQSSGQPVIDLNALPILRASQFLLTLQNPMFDAVKITLATPSHTPGRYSHKVTILCPQFDIGANTDAWDEALGGGGAGKRTNKMLTSVSKATDPTASSGEGKVAEAGKVWDKGRNWTTVVVEVVCAGVGQEADAVEDEDVLEIPVFIRMEWEGDAAEGEGEKGGREKKESAYWAVVGVGRVGRATAKAAGGEAVDQNT